MIEIKNVNFIKSAADKSGFIDFDKPAICVCGKSNVGKSSLINALAGRKNLARTSQSPGRTRLVNYFDFDKFVLVDLPGYGFAKVSKQEKDKWSNLMEDYFSCKQNITHAFVLIDVRLEPNQDDETMINYLHRYSIPFTVILTKADKIGKTRIYDRLVKTGRFLTIGEKSIIAVSSETKYNIDKVLNKIEDVLKIYYGN